MGVTQIRSETKPAARWWSPAWWGQDARWLALATVGLITVGHLSYGAELPQTALTLGASAALLLGVCGLHPQLRRELARVRDLRILAALFGLVLLVGVWSLTPFVPGGPHPVWAYVGISPGAATLDRSQTLLELTKLLGLGCFFGLGVALGASDSRMRTTLNLILMVGVAVAAWFFLDWATSNAGGDRQRLQGSFHAANTVATYLAMLLVLAVGASAAAVRTARPGRVGFAVAPPIGAGLIFLFCLLATASRGGFAAASGALIAFVLLQALSGRIRWSRTVLALLVGLLLLAAAVFAAGDFLVDRFLQEDLQESGRHQLFKAHWNAFLGAPWMGYGIGTFDTMNRLLLDSLNMKEFWSVRAAHNVYITWLEQAGVFGALPMFGCIGSTLYFSIRNTWRRTRMTTSLFALAAVSVAVLVHGATDFALETYSVAAFWSLILGLQFSGAQSKGGK